MSLPHQLAYTYDICILYQYVYVSTCTSLYIHIHIAIVHAPHYTYAIDQYVSTVYIHSLIYIYMYTLNIRILLSMPRERPCDGGPERAGRGVHQGRQD